MKSWVSGVIRILDSNDPYSPNIPKEEGSSTMSFFGIFLSIIGFIGFIVLVIFIVKAARKGGKKLSVRKTSNMGTMVMQAITTGKKVRLICCTCGLVFNNGSKGKYKLIEKDNGRGDLLSKCCSSECKASLPPDVIFPSVSKR